jgi:hypothetical protein
MSKWLTPDLFIVLLSTVHKGKLLWHKFLKIGGGTNIIPFEKVMKKIVHDT